MRRALVALSFSLLAFAGPALAAGGSGGGSNAANEAAEEATNPRIIDAPHIVVPVLRNGRLTNYLFVFLRLEIAPNMDVWAARDRAQFLRDALVRASHRGQLADPQNEDRLNEPAALVAVDAAAREAVGQSANTRMSVTQVISWRQARRGS